MNVLMISPGYPAEMAFFTRGLSHAGATVIGLGDQSADALPPAARDALIADGMVIVRHPELPFAMEMAQRFAADLRLYAS
jgi:hypothetical protein